MTEQAGKGTCALDLGRYSLLVMLRTTRSIDEAEDLGGRYHQHFQIVLPPGFFRIVLTLIIELTHSGRIASQSFRSSLTKWKMTGLLYMVCAQTTVDVAGVLMTCCAVELLSSNWPEAVKLINEKGELPCIWRSCVVYQSIFARFALVQTLV
jgi:hypothetical protein